MYKDWQIFFRWNGKMQYVKMFCALVDVVHEFQRQYQIDPNNIIKIEEVAVACTNGG